MDGHGGRGTRALGRRVEPARESEPESAVERTRSMTTTTAVSTVSAVAGRCARARARRGTSDRLRGCARRASSSFVTSASSGNDDATEASGAAAATTSMNAPALTWEYETIAGRCAMAGYAIGASREVTEGATMLEQLGREHAFGTMIICAAIGWASVAPFEFNPQEYEANPKGLMEKKGMSGFAAMEELNLNATVEETHGRLAMCGFVGTALVELVTRAPIFGH